MERLLVIAIVCASPFADAAPPRSLAFRDALEAALAHNIGIASARAEREIAGEELRLADTIFIPSFVATARYGREDQLGSPTRLEWTDKLASAELSLDGRLGTGLTYTLGASLVRQTYRSPFATIYAPAYTSSVTLELTQPLLRGAGRTANRGPIEVAQLRQAVSTEELRSRVEDIVARTETAYWDLALAYRELEAHTSSLQLARDQVAESTRLVKLGTISDLDVTEAKAGVLRKEQAVLRAEQVIALGEAALRELVLGGTWDETPLSPGDDPIGTDEIDLDVATHVALARTNRPLLRALQKRITAEQRATAVLARARLPQLDLLLSGGVTGFAGTIDPTSGVVTGTTDFVPDPAADGGLRTALGNYGNGNYAASVGLRLELPVINDAARARHQRQVHVEQLARRELEIAMLQVENEVRTSLTLIAQDKQLIASADALVKTTTQLLAGMRKRFAVGAVTSFDVLRVADDLTRAQIEAARARIAFRQAVTRVRRADGTLLEALSVSLPDLASK